MNGHFRKAPQPKILRPTPHLASKPSKDGMSRKERFWKFDFEPEWRYDLAHGDYMWQWTMQRGVTVQMFEYFLFFLVPALVFLLMTGDGLQTLENLLK